MGVAECFPSRGEPWSGSVIIQAKHTNGLNKNFSELDFFSKRGGWNCDIGVTGDAEADKTLAS